MVFVGYRVYLIGLNDTDVTCGNILNIPDAELGLI